MSKRLCLYFTRPTIDEEGVHLPLPVRLKEAFLGGHRRVVQTAEIIRQCKQILGVDLVSELYGVQLVRGDDANARYMDGLIDGLPLDKRLALKRDQTLIHAAAAHFIAESLNLKISAVSCYSGGVVAAFLYAGVFTVEGYLRSVYEFNKRARMQIIARGEDCDLSHCFLIGDPEDDLAAFLVVALRQQDVADRVFIKDERQPHMVLVGGYSPEVATVVERAQREFPALRRRQPKVSRASAAHLPIVDDGTLGQLLDINEFRPPRVAIVGIQGEIAEQNCCDRSLLRNTFLDAILAPLNTRRTVAAIASLAQEIAVVGSPLGAKVLDGVATDDVCPYRMAVELFESA